MKKSSLSLLLATASLVAFGPLAFAQDKPEKDTPPAKRAPDGKAPSPQERLKMIAEELKLTDEQKGKLQPILLEQMEKLKALREDTATPREEKIAKLREIEQASEAKIKPLLTAEQIEKWEKMKAERKQRFQKKAQ